jgi:hypothetical protein
MNIRRIEFGYWLFLFTCMGIGLGFCIGRIAQ